MHFRLSRPLLPAPLGYLPGDHQVSLAAITHAIMLCRVVDSLVPGDDWQLRTSDCCLHPFLSRQQGRGAQAKPMLEEALTLFRRVGDTLGHAETLSALGNLALTVGDYEQAQTLWGVGRATGPAPADRRSRWDGGHAFPFWRLSVLAGRLPPDWTVL
jgi:hypothetical protein